jgi:hypothetical protein
MIPESGQLPNNSAERRLRGGHAVFQYHGTLVKGIQAVKDLE